MPGTAGSRAVDRFGASSSVGPGLVRAPSKTKEKAQEDEPVDADDSPGEPRLRGVVTPEEDGEEQDDEKLRSKGERQKTLG